MIVDLLKDHQFQALEKEYKFLSRVRGSSLDNLECVIFDVETTGLEPAQFELTEIGALKIKGPDVQEIFSSLIKPTNPITPEITRLTGIDNEMVADARPARSVLASFAEFVSGAVLVAHHIDFDLPFIKYHLHKELKQEIANPIACTLKLSRYLLPNLSNHKLHTVAAHFGLDIQNRHRAMGDAELTYQIWLKFIDLLKKQNISTQRELDLLMSRL